jgi:NAD(P)-dependent dehydrogenase (short-subunit alcohol dehydrogenase family)
VKRVWENARQQQSNPSNKIVFCIGGQAGGDLDPESVLRLNLLSAIWMFEECASSLTNEPTASVVLVSSTAGIRSFPKAHAYCAAKAGLNQLVRNYGLALAPTVRVNAIAPGIIATSKTVNKERVAPESRIPLARYGYVEEICTAVSHLLLNASYTTGQILAVDGGLIL